MNNYINIIINNNIISYVTDKPNIYQGSSVDLYFNIDFLDALPDNANVELLFRRSDGDMTSWLPAEKIGKTYQFKAEGKWYAYKSGNLTYTVKATITDALKKNTQQLITTYDNIYILPHPDALFVPAPLAPSAYDIITNSINTINQEINTLQTINPIINVSGDIDATLENGEGNAYVKVQYKDNNEELITIKLPDELATESKVAEYVDKGFDSNNPVVDIQSGNENLNFYYKKYNGEEETINIKLPSDLITEEQLNTELDGIVKHSELELDDGIAPILEISVATRAYADENGNNIVETYATKQDNGCIKLNSDPNNYIVLMDLDSGNYYLPEDNSAYLYQEDVGDITKLVNGPVKFLINATSDNKRFIGNLSIYDGRLISNDDNIINSIMCSGSQRRITYHRENATKEYVDETLESYSTTDEINDVINNALSGFNATAISTISNIDNEKETNAFYVLQYADEPNLYYTQDIYTYSELIEKGTSVIVDDDDFEALWIDPTIVDAVFSEQYRTGTTIIIGTMSWTGGYSTTQNVMITIDSNTGKINSLAIGWAQTFINNGTLEKNTLDIKKFNNYTGNTTSAKITINSDYVGLFDELQPYLYEALVKIETTISQNTYELAKTEDLTNAISSLAPVATTGSYNDLTNTPTTGLVTNKTTTGVGTIPSGSYRLGTATPTAYCVAYNNGINQTTSTIFYGGENCYVPLYTFNDTTQTYDVNFNDYLYISKYNGMHYLCRSSSNIDWTYCYKIV